MSSLSKEARALKAKKRKERWEKGESNLQKAALFIKKKTGWSSKNKGVLSKAVGKFGENVEKRKTIKGRQELSQEKSRKIAKKRHETFKADRKIKDKSQKSYNKGRKDQVGSAYERRQKDADTAMRNAARKRHDEWQKKNKRGKYRVSKK